jgi:hypothetical protein
VKIGQLVQKLKRDIPREIYTYKQHGNFISSISLYKKLYEATNKDNMAFCIFYLILLVLLNRDNRNCSALERSLIGQRMTWDDRLWVEYKCVKFRVKMKAGFN